MLSVHYQICCDAVVWRECTNRIHLSVITNSRRFHVVDHMTGALLVRDLVRAGVSPAMGFAVDRYGPRYLMAGSAVVLGISLMLLSQTREIWQFILFYGVIGTFGVPGLGYSVVSPTIAKWFIRHRGRATGIATASMWVRWR